MSLFDRASIGFDFFSAFMVLVLDWLNLHARTYPGLDRRVRARVQRSNNSFNAYEKVLMDTDHGLVQRAVHFPQHDAPF